MNESQFMWVAEVQFPGKKPCWFGTVFVRQRATHQEVEEAVRAKALEYLPDGFQIIKLVRGMLILYREDDKE